MKLITELSRFKNVFQGLLEDHGETICHSWNDLVYESNGKFKTVEEIFVLKYQNILHLLDHKDEMYYKGEIRQVERFDPDYDYDFEYDEEGEE